jgi:colanic acid/amylovoran biosynthesis glycosyltransferase
MKVGFFLLKFPLSSETFVLNQITAEDGVTDVRE